MEKIGKNLERRSTLKSYRKIKPSLEDSRYPDVGKILLDEWHDLRSRIAGLNFVGGERQKRIIEKWIRVDDDCARRDIRVPFDA